MGKCPDCHHLSKSWLVRKRLAIATKNLDLDEFRPPATDQKEIGNAINKQKNEKKPRRTTGSKEKLFNLKSNIEIS